MRHQEVLHLLQTGKLALIALSSVAAGLVPARLLALVRNRGKENHKASCRGGIRPSVTNSQQETALHAPLRVSQLLQHGRLACRDQQLLADADH